MVAKIVDNAAHSGMKNSNELGDDHDAGRNVVLEDSDAGLAETERQRVISYGLNVQSAPAELSGRSLVFNDEYSIQSADEYVLQTAYYCAKLAVNFYNEHEKSKLEFLRLLKFKLVYLTTGMHTDEYDLTFKAIDGDGPISVYQAKVAFSETKGDRKAEVLLCQPSSYEPIKENRTIAAAKIEPSEDEESDDSSDSESSDSESSEDEESKMGDDHDSKGSEDEESEMGDGPDSKRSGVEENEMGDGPDSKRSRVEENEMGDGPDSKRSGVEENEMGDGPDSKRSGVEENELGDGPDSKRSKDEKKEVGTDYDYKKSEFRVGDGRDSKYLKDRCREESARVLFNWQWRISGGFDVDPNYCGLVCGGGARVFKDLASIKKLGKYMYHTAYYCAKFAVNYRNEKEHEKSKLEFVELVKFNYVRRRLCYLPEMYYLTFKARSDGADIVSEYQAQVSFQEHRGERDAEVMLFRRRKSSKGV